MIVANPARVLAIVRDPARPDPAHARAAHQQRGREQKTATLYAFITSEHCKQLLDQVETQAGKMLELDAKEQEAHRRPGTPQQAHPSVQKARSDLVFEIDRIIGTAGNGPEDEAA